MKQSDGQNRDSKRFLKGLLIVLILAIIFKYLFEHWMVPTLLAGVSAAGPFIIGLVIAYLMRFAVNPLERLLMKLLRKKEPKRWIRVTAAAVSLVSRSRPRVSRVLWSRSGRVSAQGRAAVLI